MRVTITYLNEGGFECKATIEDPMAIHHTWYSSKKNAIGKYDKHEVTVFGQFMNLLKNCSKVRVVAE